MNDPLQQALQNFALQDSLTRELAIVCALYVVFLMAVAWVVVALVHRSNITMATVVRVVLLMVVSYVVAKVLGHIVNDPRPYLVEHLKPFAPVSHDNGFPSDHALLASALTASLWWFRRRLIPLFALGTLIVMAGRLAIEAHHTLDVAGSAAIVLVVMLLVAALPMPAAWERPVLPARQESRRAA